MEDINVIYVNHVEYDIVEGKTYTGKEIKVLGDIDLSYQLWYLGMNVDDLLICNGDELVLKGGECFQVVPIADRS
jgi:hypothetical protein